MAPKKRSRINRGDGKVRERVTVLLAKGAIKKGKSMAKAQRASFSDVVETLILEADK